jgi:hypothetical protein
MQRADLQQQQPMGGRENQQRAHHWLQQRGLVSNCFQRKEVRCLIVLYQSRVLKVLGLDFEKKIGLCLVWSILWGKKRK